MTSPLAALVVAGCITGLAILTRRQPTPPISPRTMRRLREREEET